MDELRKQLIYRERDFDWKYKHDFMFYITLAMFILTCSFFMSFLNMIYWCNFSVLSFCYYLKINMFISINRADLFLSTVIVIMTCIEEKMNNVKYYSNRLSRYNNYTRNYIYPLLYFYINFYIGSYVFI